MEIGTLQLITLLVKICLCISTDKEKIFLHVFIFVTKLLQYVQYIRIYLRGGVNLSVLIGLCSLNFSSQTDISAIGV